MSSVIAENCVTWHVTKVDKIVAHIDISLFPILRISSADDVIFSDDVIEVSDAFFQFRPAYYNMASKMSHVMLSHIQFHSGIPGPVFPVRISGSKILGLRSKLTSSCIQ